MLTFANLTKTYAGGGTAALSQVDLAVQAGEIAAIVGGSGCGKTTLLRLTAGLDQASSGFIEIDGDRVTTPHPAIGIVFQEPRLLPWLTVRDNVAFGLGDQPRAARRQRPGCSPIERGTTTFGWHRFHGRCARIREKYLWHPFQ